MNRFKIFRQYSITLPSIYILTAAACVIYALNLTDKKGKLVILQLPIALQAAVVEQIGLGFLLDQMSWITAYIALGVPAIGLLYGLGTIIDKLKNQQ